MGIFRRHVSTNGSNKNKNKNNNNSSSSSSKTKKLVDEATPVFDSTIGTTGTSTSCLEQRPKITMVILEFPPLFSTDSACSSAVNATIVFRHETDSVMSDCSNCSCRISNHGRRRPDSCAACSEMRENQQRRAAQRQAAELANRGIPPILTDITDQNVAEYFSPNLQDHVLPTSIALLSKIMITPPGVHHQHKRSSTDVSPPSSTKVTFRHNILTKSKSSSGFAWSVSKPSDSRSLSITADLSLDHELS